MQEDPRHRLAQGIGMSISNAKAVLEAVFNQESEFTRTPKYGIERKAQRWSPKEYPALKSARPFVELVFAICFTYFIVSAALDGQWFSLPFLALLQGGARGRAFRAGGCGDARADHHAPHTVAAVAGEVAPCKG